MFHQLRANSIKYSAITAINLQNQLAYAWDAISRALFIVIFMFIFTKLWSAVYETQPGPEIAGLTLSSTIWYFLIAEMMEMSRFRHDVRITEEVKDGSIAYTLNRPYNYLVYHFANGLGETVFRMILLFLFGLPLVMFYAGMPTLEWRHLPFVFLVIGLAMVMDFIIFSIIGLLAFVTEDTASFRLIYQKLVFILGGLIIPLDFLPEWLQRIARWLPFNLTTYAPARLFVGFSFEQFRQFVSLQLLWILLLGGLLVVQYRRATRRLVINGG